MRRKQIISVTLRESVFIVLLAGCLALAVNGFRENPLPLADRPKTAIGPSDGSTPVETVPAEREIPMQEAVRLFETGAALFVDARSADDYRAGHIKGAVNMPVAEFDERIGLLFETVPPGIPLITYCEGEMCHLSQELSEKLVLAGFEPVYHLKDGWGQWKARRLPYEKE
jgi:rhodanese-related sulfurtransferase